MTKGTYETKGTKRSKRRTEVQRAKRTTGTKDTKKTKRINGTLKDYECYYPRDLKVKWYKIIFSQTSLSDRNHYFQKEFGPD